MQLRTAFSRLKHVVCRLRHDRAASVSVIFAFALIPMLAAVGAAIDYSRANDVKVKFQTALDSTALKLSKEASTDTSDQLQTNATNYFKALFTATNSTVNSISATFSSSGGKTIVVNGTVKVPTVFMQIFGYDYITLTQSSTAAWGDLKMRVSLVLDNTGSMASSGKIGALKTASHNLLSTLQNAAQNPGDVEVAIVPFANGVNVGTGNVAATWLNWTYFSKSGGWSSGGSYYDYGGGSYGSYGSYSGGWGGSGGGTYQGSYSSWGGSWYGGGGSSTGSCGWSSCWQNSNSSWSTSTYSTNTAHWQGCVMDRDQDYDVQNTTPDQKTPGTLFPAIYSTSCPVALLPLTDDWTALNNEVDQMSPRGTTNQTIGLVWGWQALTPGDPLNPPAADSSTQQVIILLTDGLNTENRWSTNQADIDARTEMVCDNIKAAGIMLYTIQVNTGGDPTSTLLQNCASDSSKFFLLTSADQIITTFDSIGSNLAKLRLAK